MAFSLSPFVEVIEQNAAFNVPNLPSTRTGTVLKSDYGPAFERTRIDSETTLRDTFKDPTKYNFKDWYNCWNFLQYANSLWAVRPIDLAMTTPNTGMALSGGISGLTLTFLTSGISGSFAVADALTQAVTGATANIIRIETVGSNTIIYISNSKGTFDTTNIISNAGASGSGTPTVVASTAATIALETYQGISNIDLYNQDTAELTILNLVTDSHSGRELGVLDDAGGGLVFTSLTRLRDQAMTVFDSTDTGGAGTGSRTLVVNEVDTLYIAGSAGTYTYYLANGAALAGWNIDVGDIVLGSGEATTFSNGSTVTGATSGATGTVASIESGTETLSLTGVVGTFLPNEAVTGNLSGEAGTLQGGSATDWASSMKLTGFSTNGSGPYTALGTVKDVRLTFYHKYVSASNQNIAIAVCSNKASWVENVSTDILSKFKSFFNFTPDFDNGEFAVQLFIKEDDGSFSAITTESWIVSYNEGSRDVFNRNNEASEVFLHQSQYLYCHVAATPSSGALDVNTGGSAIPVLHHVWYDSIYPRIGVEGSTADIFPAASSTANGAYDANGYSQADIDEAFTLFNDQETFDVNILMSHEDSINEAASIANSRKDCVAIVAPFDETQLVGKTSAVATTYLTDKFGIIDVDEDPTFTQNSTYASVYGNMKYQLDKFNDINRWMPVVGDVAGLIAENDIGNDPWFAVAGTNRGIIKNAIKTAFTPNKANRDDLYVNSINPILAIAGEGNAVVFGQKTSTGTASAFDRLNVRRLFIFVEKAIATALKPYLFEFNDIETRDRIRGTITPFLDEIQARRGIFDFQVIIDGTNNPSAVIDAMALVLDVLIKPTKVAEFIQIKVTAVGTGTEFSELSV